MTEDNLHSEPVQENEAASAAPLTNRNCDQKPEQIHSLAQDINIQSDQANPPEAKTDGLEARISELYDFAPPTPVKAKGWLESQIEETQVGIGNIVAERHKGQFLFTESHGWYAWTGIYWQTNRKLLLRAIETVLMNRIAESREEMNEAFALEKAAKEKGEKGCVKADNILKESNFKIKVAKRLLSAKGLNDIENICRSRFEFEATLSQFDRNPWLLNCPNGTLNLKTGILQSHRREDFITRVIETEYHQTAMCPMWEKFLTDIMIGNMAMVLYLQRLLGLCLSGDASNACFFILYGKGRNGKSTLIGTIQELLGERYSQEVPAELLLSHRTNPQGPSEGYARLVGIRMATANESDEGQRLAVSKVKQLTGGDKVTARFLHKPSFEFKPEFKLLLRTNHPPEIPSNDNAIWARVRPIPFLADYKEHPDRELPEKLKSELPGILAWAVRGFHDYLQVGLDEPAFIKDEINRYRSKMDEFCEFLESEILPQFEHTDQDIEASVEEPKKRVIEPLLLKEIHAAYQTWAQEMQVPVLSSKAISSKLKLLDWQEVRREAGMCFSPPRKNNPT